MFQLATVPRLTGILGQDVTEGGTIDDGSGSETSSTIEQLNDFANSSAGQNIIANLLNMASTKTTGQPAVFRTGSGFATASQGVNPQILILGAVGLGLLLYFGRK